MSFSRNVYYDLKPFLPSGVRMAMRRLLAKRQLKKSVGKWPIDPAAGTPPKNWPGWPDGKQFALVLTHDVEGPRGLANCEALMQLEMDLGFRSSFNFIPEGPYKVPASLINRLVENGFEVGVHDLHHNGKLYRNKKRFDAAAPRINHHLREWNAVGFRSGFMHRNLDWLHALDIEYDMSTFDTDPFEPQPDGVHTIFPFWVPALGHSTQPSGLNPQLSTYRSATSTQHIETDSPLSGTLRNSNFEIQPADRSVPVSTLNSQPSTLNSSFSTQHSAPEREAHKGSTVLACTQHSRLGYAELPYTLPQDSTLFLLLQQRDITVWKQKLDWIAQCGGMALLNVHPDYISFADRQPNTFASSLYGNFLRYVLEKYSATVYCALPRVIASSVSNRIPAPSVERDLRESVV